MNYSLARLEEIYTKCLDLEGPALEKYIETACHGNEALEAAVRKMLQNSPNAEKYFQDLQQTLLKGFESDELPELKIGETIGKYRIIKFIGQGGMSRVYLGERTDGQFEQRVAIKCFAQKVNEENESLFYREEQKILAKLQHANVAAIYDAGITPENIPYFIMEYIEGRSLDEYLAEHKLSLDDKLGLFKLLAETVGFAHRHFILHLDLKPSNVMVRDTGYIKLLDFGISKALTKTKENSHSFIGTPAIAAPEQLSGDELSMATDIFQLGLLLHRIIKGTYPSGAVSSTLTFGVTQGIQDQSYVARNVDKDLPHELSAIIEKCIQPRPDDRYQTTGELLQDIANYKGNYPVSSVEPSFSYTLSKFFKRNRTAIFSLVFVFIALLTGAAISLWQAKQARTQRDLAEKNEQISRATKDYLLGLFMEAHPSNSRGDTMHVYQLLESGFHEADKYEGSPEIKLEMYTTMSELYRAMGDFVKSGEALEKAESVIAREDIPVSLSYILALQQQALYYRDIGYADSALTHMLRAVQLFDQIHYPQKDSMYTASLKKLAFLYRRQNKTDSAKILMQQTIDLEEQIWPDKQNINLAESYYIMGSIYKDEREYERALDYTKKSLQLCKSIMGIKFPGTIVNLNALAQIAYAAKDFDQSVVHYREATQIANSLYGKWHMETATSAGNLGNSFIETGNFDSAYYYNMLALEIQRKIYPAEQHNRILITYNNILRMFLTFKKTDSIPGYLPIALRISEAEHITPRTRSITYSNAGDYYKERSMPDSADMYYRQTLTEYAKYLPEDDQKVIALRNKLEAR